MSPDHPDLWNTAPPPTTAASEGIAAKWEEVRQREMEGDESDGESTEARSATKKKEKRKRPPRLSMFEVSEIAVSKAIKTFLELLALAKRQKMEGKTDLAQFIVNRGKQSVEEAIRTGWEIENSEETLRRQRMS